MSTSGPRPVEAAQNPVAERAAFWDSLLRSPNCTDADRARFVEWRDADTAHRAKFERLQMLSAALKGAENRADVRGLHDEAVASIARRRRVRSWSVAASMLVLIGGIVLYARVGPVWNRTDAAGRYETQTGQRTVITLRDGSVVELNARTTVEVRLGVSRRDLTLVAGQALFRVARDPARPFVVRAGDRDIIAVGTEFDVRLEPSSVQVTLLEGRVNVDRRNTPDTVRASLRPGQQLIASLHSAAGSPMADSSSPADVLREVDVARATGWREGRIFLRNLSLSRAVEEMNRYSPKQIVVQDPALDRFTVNGMFRAGEPEAFADALQRYFPVRAENHGDLQIVLVPRR